MNRIKPRATISTHSVSIISLRRLIIDMKLSLQGEPHDAIATEDRIKELERVVDELRECRERMIYY